MEVAGSWELSLKNNDQHIVLHQPMPAKHQFIPSIFAREECLLKVHKESLTEQESQEKYLQTAIETTALLFDEE